MRTGILLVNFNWSDVQSNTKFNMTTQFQTPPECPRDNTFQAFRSFVTLPSLPLPLPPMKVNLKVTQSCLPLCDPMNCTVHGIFQARILEWVAFPFSRGSSQPRDWTQVSNITGKFFTSWATREALSVTMVNYYLFPNLSKLCVNSWFNYVDWDIYFAPVFLHLVFLKYH